VAAFGDLAGLCERLLQSIVVDRRLARAGGNLVEIGAAGRGAAPGGASFLAACVSPVESSC
jgi:hypothetical protein